MLIVNYPYHAFTQTAIKEDSFMHHPIIELMGLIN